jgi:hypothetical protein
MIFVVMQWLFWLYVMISFMNDSLNQKQKQYYYVKAINADLLLLKNCKTENEYWRESQVVWNSFDMFMRGACGK